MARDDPARRVLELIGTQRVGRVAILVEGVPEIYPINFAVDARTIVFRTDPGSKLRGLVNSPMVCFEVDGTDARHRDGWSVLVKGRAVGLTTVADLAQVKDVAVDPWAGGAKSHWIRIEPIEVTGRRIHPKQPRH